MDTWLPSIRFAGKRDRPVASTTNLLHHHYGMQLLFIYPRSCTTLPSAGWPVASPTIRAATASMTRLFSAE